MAAAEGENNVWRMIQETGSTAIQAYVDIMKSRNTTDAEIARTRAAPMGDTLIYGRNPPPGSLGRFPQAETKPGADADDLLSGGMFGLTWGTIGAIVIVVFLALFLVRK